MKIYIKGVEFYEYHLLKYCKVFKDKEKYSNFCKVLNRSLIFLVDTNIFAPFDFYDIKECVFRYLYFRKYDLCNQYTIQVHVLTPDNYRKILKDKTSTGRIFFKDNWFYVFLQYDSETQLEITMYHECEHLYQYCKRDIEDYHVLDYELRPSEITAKYYSYLFYKYFHEKLKNEVIFYNVQKFYYNIPREIRKLTDKIYDQIQKNTSKRFFLWNDRKEYLDFALQCALGSLMFYKKLKN